MKARHKRQKRAARLDRRGPSDEEIQRQNAESYDYMQSTVQKTSASTGSREWSVQVAKVDG